MNKDFSKGSRNQIKHNLGEPADNDIDQAERKKDMGEKRRRYEEL